MVAKQHDCRKESEVRHATFESPYHFVESGLPNVYLVGIDYRVCPGCNLQSADIPALDDLMTTIARIVVRKEGHLTGAEVRFLRKRLHLKSASFANVIGVSPEHMSRWENANASLSDTADRFIRLCYAVLSEDPALDEMASPHLLEWLANLSGEETKQDIKLELREDEWAVEPVNA